MNEVYKAALAGACTGLLVTLLTIGVCLHVRYVGMVKKAGMEIRDKLSQTISNN